MDTALLAGCTEPQLWTLCGHSSYKAAMNYLNNKRTIAEQVNTQDKIHYLSFVLYFYIFLFYFIYFYIILYYFILYYIILYYKKIIVNGGGNEQLLLTCSTESLLGHLDRDEIKTEVSGKFSGPEVAVRNDVIYGRINQVLDIFEPVSGIFICVFLFCFYIQHKYKTKMGK